MFECSLTITAHWFFFDVQTFYIKRRCWAQTYFNWMKSPSESSSILISAWQNKEGKKKKKEKDFDEQNIDCLVLLRNVTN